MRGTYVMPLGEGLAITISTLPYTGFMLSSTLGPFPEKNDEQFFETLLRANLFGDGTRGAVLGLNPEGTKVILTRIIEYRIDYNEFRDIIEDFINVADLWRDEAKEFAKSA
jgi:hypothetical protein